LTACNKVTVEFDRERSATRGSAIAEGPRDAVSVEILPTAAQLDEKSRLKRL